MEKETTRAKLLLESNVIYAKYYAKTIPITEVAGGMENTINSAVEAVSKFTTPTEEMCNVYFEINSSVLSYLRLNGQQLREAYVRNAKPTIGSIISPEQILANEITLAIISGIASAATTALIKNGGKIINKIKSILKRKTKYEISETLLQQHAEKIFVNVSKSNNVKVDINAIAVQRKKPRKARPKKGLTGSESSKKRNNRNNKRK
jgi:hypothetical protein